MRNSFMTYYEHIAKLSVIANKQTLFLAHALSRAEFDYDLKQLVVELSPRIKKQILLDIGAKSKNPLNLAKGYLSQLTKAGLLKFIGSGTYAIDPESYSYSKYISKELRQRSTRIFDKLTYESNGKEISSEIWVEINTGEIKQVINGQEEIKE